MVSLWGSKNDGEGEREGGDAPATDGEEGTHDNPRHSDSHDADERTRLLPPRREGYLDPDDPAVSLGVFVKHEKATKSKPIRLPLITYGASGLCVTSQWSFWSSRSCGGCYYSFPSSSAPR